MKLNNFVAGCAVAAASVGTAHAQFSGDVIRIGFITDTYVSKRQQKWNAASLTDCGQEPFENGNRLPKPMLIDIGFGQSDQKSGVIWGERERLQVQATRLCRPFIQQRAQRKLGPSIDLINTIPRFGDCQLERVRRNETPRPSLTSRCH